MVLQTNAAFSALLWHTKIIMNAVNAPGLRKSRSFVTDLKEIEVVGLLALSFIA